MGVSRARILGGLGLSLLSAVFLVVIWEAFGNLWWLTFVAFVPMYLAQYRLLPRRWSAVPVGLAFAAYYLALAAVGSSVLPTWVILGIAAVFGSSASPSEWCCGPSPNGRATAGSLCSSV